MTESSLAKCSPSSIILYSTLLLEVVNASLTTRAMDKPSGDYKTIPAPLPIALDNSSVSRSHDVSQRSCG